MKAQVSLVEVWLTTLSVYQAIQILTTLRQNMKDNIANKGLMDFESRWCCSDNPFLVIVSLLVRLSIEIVFDHRAFPGTMGEAF
jgi:hypothetical protein